MPRLWQRRAVDDFGREASGLDATGPRTMQINQLQCDMGCGRVKGVQRLPLTPPKLRFLHNANWLWTGRVQCSTWRACQPQQHQSPAVNLLALSVLIQQKVVIPGF